MLHTQSLSPSPEASSKGPSIRLTTRHERSLYAHLIQLLIRPFRNHLGRPSKQQPKGSIPLSPHKGTRKLCNVHHHTICDIHVYDILAKNPPPHGTRKRIYYFSGGGWQSPPSSQHWFNCAKMVHDVPDTAVSLVSSPLAPNNPASRAFPWLLRFYREIMARAVDTHEDVILAGDSSGGNIVLSLVLEALREDNVAPKGNPPPPHPTAIIAICPSTDLTRSNPDIVKLARNDPLLTPDFVKSTAKAWVGEWDATDPRVSPINADLSLLARSGIHVHGITAGHDLLSPDSIIFREKLAENGVSGHWLHWEKQMHCFVLLQAYGVSEARGAIDWVMRVLDEE